jgi:tetratricopeptide (TPR) repeat protein
MAEQNRPIANSARCLVALALSAVSGAGALRAEGDPTDVLPFRAIELSLRLDKSVYVLGEPIAVYARLVNPHTQPVKAHDSWGWFRRGGARWQGGDVELCVYLTRGGKSLDLKRPYGMPYGLRTAGRPCPIPPGGVRRAKQLIVYGDPRASAFLSGGEVQINLEFRGLGLPQETVTSNRARIAIDKPQGRDADAFRWLSQRRLLPYLGYHTFLAPLDERLTDGLKAFLAQFAETAYAPYVRWALGQAYFYRKQYAEARPVFAELAEEHAKLSIAEDALFLVAECHRRLKQPVEADRLFREVVRTYPQTPASDDAQEALAELARLPEMFYRDDRRLDVQIEYAFPQLTSMEDALRRVSQLGGVSLRLAPELRGMAISTGPNPQADTLRGFMAKYQHHELHWVREHDGAYRLVRASAASSGAGAPGRNADR